MINTSNIEVDYVDHMGTDLTVTNAARVSFHKHKDEFDESDAKLIKYLAEHDHWSPFAHTSIQLRIKAPIFIARQLVKHQVGGVWNEVSRRYVSSPPEFFMPREWRGKPVNAKQGSDGVVNVSQALIEATIESSVSTYEYMLSAGVAPEMARMVLPQNMMTEWYWTGSLVFWARVYGLRSKPDAQEENKIITNRVNEIISDLFPTSWKALI